MLNTVPLILVWKYHILEVYLKWVHASCEWNYQENSESFWNLQFSEFRICSSFNLLKTIYFPLLYHSIKKSVLFGKRKYLNRDTQFALHSPIYIDENECKYIVHVISWVNSEWKVVSLFGFVGKTKAKHLFIVFISYLLDVIETVALVIACVGLRSFPYSVNDRCISHHHENTNSSSIYMHSLRTTQNSCLPYPTEKCRNGTLRRS